MAVASDAKADPEDNRDDTGSGTADIGDEDELVGESAPGSSLN